MVFDARRILMLGGVISAALALFHVVVIFVGAPAYRYFGVADLAQLAEAGSPLPALITLLIVGVLSAFAAYAFSGAGMIRRLPLLGLALVLIGCIYTLRGLNGVLISIVLAFTNPEFLDPMGTVVSLGALVTGVAYLVGALARRQRQRVVTGFGL